MALKWKVLIIVVAVLCFLGIFPPTGIFLRLILADLTSIFDHEPSFLAKLDVDLDVNGRPVHFERILECETYEAPAGGIGDRPTKLFGRLSTRYAVNVGALGYRLPDGSAVIMWTPYLCAHKVVEESWWRTVRKPLPLPDGVIPYMAWAPNADTLEKLEVYVSPSYFDQPNARIKIKRVQISEAPQRADADPPDEFEWFTTKPLPNEERKHLPRFKAYSRVVLAEKEWRGQNSELDTLLDTINEPTVIQGAELPGGETVDLAVKRIFEKHFGRLSTHTNRQPRMRYDNEGTGRNMFMGKRSRFLDKIASVSIKSDGINVDRVLSQGFLALTLEGKFENPSKVVFKESIIYRYLKTDHFNGFIYDPESKRILYVFNNTRYFRARRDSAILHRISGK
ncbi:MAG: hypothetical protein H6907_03910 [Hyphomicrobiales bacterium]|nr:hypothetical protein [Hyphomicrobiales bacterium]